MATILKEYPRLFTYQKKGATYFRVDLRDKDYQGKQKTKDFNNEKDARKFRDDFRAALKQGGFSAVAPIQSPRLDKLDKQCAIWGRTPEEAVNVACRIWFDETAVKQSKLMSELLLMWQSDKETGLKQQRTRSLTTIKSFVKLFNNYFGNYRIKEVTDEVVESYLKSREMEPQTQRNNLRYLQNFFNWAIFRKYHNANPAKHWLKEIVVSKETVEFYNVDKCSEILRRLLIQENNGMIGYYTLGLFAGVRPEEAEKLNWSNILWDTKEVYIPARIAKTKSDRQFLMNDTLCAWLSLIRDTDLPLIPQKNLRKLKTKVMGKVSFEKVQDGLRHTYATFMYAKCRNYETLKSIMGNSPSIIEKHYKGVISEIEIDKFFGLTPTYVKEHNSKEKVTRYLKTIADNEAEQKLKLPDGAAKQKVSDYLDRLKNIKPLPEAANN